MSIQVTVTRDEVREALKLLVLNNGYKFKYANDAFIDEVIKKMQTQAVMIVKEDFMIPYYGMLLEAGWSWDWNKHQRMLRAMTKNKFNNESNEVQLAYLKDLIQQWVNVGWVECEGFVKGEVQENPTIRLKPLTLNNGVV